LYSRWPKTDNILRFSLTEKPVNAIYMSVVSDIVGYAKVNNVDLIVIGSRGMAGFKKLLIGSVASGVLTYAHCPVLIVK
jgi:nucleotide-binding universal stress UspA family protein